MTDLTFSFAMIIGDLTKIPGLSSTYMDVEGQKFIADLYNLFFHEAKFLLKILLIITLTVSIFFEEKWPLGVVVRQAFLSIVVLLATPFLFSATINIGIGFSNKIFPPTIAKQFEEIIEQQSINQRDNKAPKVAPDPKKVEWYEMGFYFISVANPLNPISLLMITLHGLFWIVQGALNILWVLILAIIFVISPIPAVLAIIPGWGAKILANWYITVVQLAMLKIWLALCGAILTHAQVVIIKTNTYFLTASQLGIAGLYVIFLALYILGPIFISKIIMGSTLVSSISETVTAITFFGLNEVRKGLTN